MSMNEPVATPIGMTRRPVSLDPSTLVTSGPYAEGQAVPWLFRPQTTVDLAQWVKTALAEIEGRLHAHGAVLFRGFGIASAAQFEQVAMAFTDDLLNYVEGSSPRTMVSAKVYTSTEYPAEYRISMHNELSYAHKWPGKLFFFCQTPAAAGGETPVADGRKMLELLPAPLVQRFADKGVRYLRTMHDGRGPGLSWQTVFETDDRDAVETYCREGDIDFTWRGDGWLHTSQVRPGVVRHPVAGDAVWFNQADQWHPSNLGDELDAAITSVSDQRELPLFAEYGDGTPIDPADLAIIREAAHAASVAVPWQAGDILVVDNTMAMHGRLPFTGPRRVLVSMGDTVHLSQVRPA